MVNKRKAFSFKTLSMQFLLNYFLLFLVLILIGIALFTLSLYVLSAHYDLGSLDFDIVDIYEDMQASNMRTAYANAQLPKGSYVELIDENLIVTAQINSDHTAGYQYSQAFFNRILINYYPEYSFYYPENEKQILLVVTPEFDQSYKFLKGLIGSFIGVLLCLLIAVIIYSKITSVIFLKPINKLLEGVTSLSLGDYSTRIAFKSRNELGTLRDAINDMAQRIQDEIQLREKSEANRKQLIMDISHDLKTPLTNILGYTETLINNPDLAEATKEKYLNVVHVNSERANNLIKNLFEFSKLEIEVRETPMEKWDVCEFIRNIISSYINELETHQMTYDFNIPEDEFFCLLHPESFERAISNLIVNTIKHSGKKTHLLIEVVNDGASVQIIVQDNGKGVDPDFAQAIFDPFFRADRARNSKTGGTGLGLAISRAIIERHHGTLELDPVYQTGCRFVIEIPCVSSSDTQ